MQLRRINLFCVGIMVMGYLFGTAGWAADTIEWKGGTAGAISHPYAQGGPKFLEIMNTKTGGKFTGKWFHSGQVGGEADVLSQVKNNTLQFCSISPALAGTLNPKATTMFSPYLVKDWDTFDKVWLGSEGAKLVLDCLIKDHKILGIDWLMAGFDTLAYKDPPIRKLEDVKGRKLRAAQIYSIMETLEALGANATPISWTEVYQAIQQNVVTGLSTPPAFLIANRFHEVLNNVTVSNHLLSTHIFWVREDSLKALSPDMQKMVLESIHEACKWEQQIIKKYEADAAEELKTKHGTKFWTLSDQEMARWIKATNKVWLSHEKKINEKSGDGRAFLRTVFKSVGRNYDKEILGQ